MNEARLARKDIAFVEACLRMALGRRDQTGHPIEPGMTHHSDAGSQYASIRLTETVALEGLTDSTASSETFHPRNTSVTTPLELSAHQTVTPPTKRRHEPRDDSIHRHRISLLVIGSIARVASRSRRWARFCFIGGECRRAPLLH